MRGEEKISHALATITQQLQYLERMVIDLQTRKMFEVTFNDVASESDESSDGYESAPAANDIRQSMRIYGSMDSTNIREYLLYRSLSVLSTQ